MEHVEARTNGSEAATNAARLQLCEQQIREQAEQLAETRKTVGVLVAALKCAATSLEP